MTKDENLGAGRPALNKLVRQLQDNKSSLHIGRIPTKTRELFVAIADEEFCSDYGMLLKFLLDKVIDNDNQAIVNKIEQLEERMDELEHIEPKTEVAQEETGLKTLSGRKLNLQEEKNE